MNAIMSKLLVPVTLLFVLPLAACSTDSAEQSGLSSYGLALVEVQEEGCVDLMAGQHIDVGHVCASVEGDDLLVTFGTTDGWYLVETHLWLGLDIADLPITRQGNPIVGQFPLHSGDIHGHTEYTVTVPLSLFGLSSDMTTCEPTHVYLVAHAVVETALEDGTFQTETAYGFGDRIVERGNWATHFGIVLGCVEEDDVVAGSGCETAFAFGDELATCFIDSELVNTARWGWFNGPMGPGSYYLDIYAGAGLCDLTKGTLVGWLEVEFDGSQAEVTYNMLGDFTMKETHLYVGELPLPIGQNGAYTTAPGLYGNANSLDDAGQDSFVITDLPSEIYVVAHAVVCHEEW